MIEKVLIDQTAHAKIMHWVNKSFYEVSGLGTIRMVDGAVLVTDAVLLPQKNGHAHTDIEPEDVARLEYEMRASGGDLRFWWHSHVNMPTFWSAQDKETQKDLSAGGWFLSTVFNKKGEKRSAICMSKPISIFIDDIPTQVVSTVNLDLIKQWDEQYEQNVTTSVFPIVQYGSGGKDWWKKKEEKEAERVRAPESIAAIIEKYRAGELLTGAEETERLRYEASDDLRWIMRAYECSYSRALEIEQEWARGGVVEEDQPGYGDPRGDLQ